MHPLPMVNSSTDRLMNDRFIVRAINDRTR